MWGDLLIDGVILLGDELEDIVVVEEVVEHGALRGGYLLELVLLVLPP